MSCRTPLTLDRFTQPDPSDAMPSSAFQTHRIALVLLSAGALALSGCNEPARSAWSGYAEGDYLYVSSPIGGRVDVLNVKEGDAVKAGQPLFALDAAAEQAALAQAEAQADSVRAQQANVEKGRRPDELAVTAAQVTQAKAQALQAAQSYERQAALVKQGFASPATLDAVRATRDQTAARVTELQASLKVARLPARPDEQASASAQVAAAEQAVAQARWRLDQKQIRAPADATVTDVLYQPGEVAGAAQPVLTLLPPAALKALFFVPEGEIAKLKVGDTVRVNCDACGGTLSATISQVASGPEFTPPVIYSNAQRAKLVYRIEASVAAADAPRLHPGQPIDVSLPGDNAP